MARSSSHGPWCGRFGLRIPIRPFFLATGAFLYYLAIVFAGRGVHELQEAGVLALTPVTWAPTIVALANAHKFMPSGPVRLLGTAADLLLDNNNTQHVRSDAGHTERHGFVDIDRRPTVFDNAADEFMRQMRVGAAVPARLA